MNYYNPYLFYPYSAMSTPASSGLLSGILGRGGLNFSSLLNGAQRTLNFVNQAIPVVKQVSPMMKNAKTMFKVMNEFKKVDTPNNKESVSGKTNHSEVKQTDLASSNSSPENGPTFFV